MTTLLDLWDQQKAYNERIKKQVKKSPDEWTQDYVMGTFSELNELMAEINWKPHRLHSFRVHDNLEEELADVTKYIFCLWQHYGYSHEDMLQITHTKGELLDQLLKQETTTIPSDKFVLMLDLDGSIADFREGFMRWLPLTQWGEVLLDRGDNIGIHMDVNNDWPFHEYTEAKMEFEKQGGYKILPPITNNIEWVKEFREKTNCHIIVYTARPYTVHRRIWKDTWQWLMDYEVPVDELHFGHEERISRARQIKETHQVIAIDDDPILIKRYISSGIPVLVSEQPYNSHMINEGEKEYEKFYAKSRQRNHS